MERKTKGIGPGMGMGMMKEMMEGMESVPPMMER